MFVLAGALVAIVVGAVAYQRISPTRPVGVRLGLALVAGVLTPVVLMVLLGLLVGLDFLVESW